MGTTCCVQPPIKSSTKSHQFKVYHQLDEIYVPEQEIQASRLIEQPAAAITKRTSEPSLLPLNQEMTNMIHTFQNKHGKITNSFTRFNTMENTAMISLTPGVKNEQNISDILWKPSKFSSSLGIRKEPIQVENNNVIVLPSIKQNKENEQKDFEYESSENQQEKLEAQQKKQKKKTKNSIQNLPQIRLKDHSDKKPDIQFDRSGSWNEENQCSSDEEYRLQESSNMLDLSLVNSDIDKQKEALLQKYNTIEGIVMQKWSFIHNVPFSMTLKEIAVCQFTSSVVIASLSSIAIYYQQFKISLCAYQKQQNSYHVKCCINGQKRSMIVQQSDSQAPMILSKVLKRLYQNNKIQTNPCNQIYHLSGWVPEILQLQDIQNKDNLWDRLVENYSEGNILITFGSVQNQQYLTLYSIDTQLRNLKLVYSKSAAGTVIDQNLRICEIAWSKLVELVTIIYINWNPSIYNLVRKIDSKWIARTSPFQNQENCLDGNPQYLIKIPKHSQDFEIRVFADRYCNYFSAGKRLTLKLFEYDGQRILNPTDAIRTLQVDYRELISDVFIFEKSDTVDYFVLVVMHDDDECPEEMEVAYSLMFLSFVDVHIKELPRREVLLTESTSAKATLDNLGFGLNSPDFLKNLQFSLKIPPESTLQVHVEASVPCQFSLILIEDKNNKKDISKVDFETVLNESTISQIFEKYGYLERTVLSEHYILVIALTGYPGKPVQFRITANILSKMFNRNREIESCYSPISLREIQFNAEILKEYPINWSFHNPGPRKRLKQTSNQTIYHPASVFQEFLQNPHVSMKLQKGCYQLNLICESYREEFFQMDYMQGEPPALSLALFKNSDNNKGYRIILDDAYYIPIGYGFWSSELHLEQGRYTVVCSRVEKASAIGKLALRKL